MGVPAALVGKSRGDAAPGGGGEVADAMDVFLLVAEISTTALPRSSPSEAKATGVRTGVDGAAGEHDGGAAGAHGDHWEAGGRGGGGETGATGGHGDGGEVGPDGDGADGVQEEAHAGGAHGGGEEEALVASCVVCRGRQVADVGGICSVCLRRRLLSSVACVDDMSAIADATAGVGRLHYCPSCDAFGRGVHDHEVIVLEKFKGDWCAWMTGDERIAPIFVGIESDRFRSPFLGRPYMLQPPPATRCRVCSDIASLDGLYSRPATLCTIACWARADHAAAAAAHPWVQSLLEVGCGAEPEQVVDLFCLTCRKAFNGDCHCDAHHDLLPLVFQSSSGLCVRITRGHSLWSVWESIGDGHLATDILHSSATRLVPIRAMTAQRCRWCQKRLVDGGGSTCSLRCRLTLPTLLPRALYSLPA